MFATGSGGVFAGLVTERFGLAVFMRFQGFTMFTTHRLTRVLVAMALVVVAWPVDAAGQLEGVAFTKEPSPIAGHVIVRTVPSRWADRCLPVRWRVNDSQDPIPNAFVESPVSVAEATTALQQALDTWNVIPTSFATMQIVGTVSNHGPAGFDFVNEVHFGSDPLFGTFARLTRLVEDSILSDGDDLNGDGASDVGDTISTCQDVNGRTMFPAGFYGAGTILDADLVFETQHHTPITVGDADLGNPFGYDLQGLALHEFGHTLGLGHSLHTQRSDRDGRDAVMGGQYPFDPVFKLLQRTPDSDDAAWLSYFYPEGTASAGPAALQPGDVAFASRYGVIAGTLRHGRYDTPIPGGVVFAQDQSSREVVASGYTGTIRLSGDPVTGELAFLPPELGVVDGRFVIPVPAGTYSLYVKPVGLPAYPINFTTDAGSVYGLLDFHEERVDSHDDASELRPDIETPIQVHAGRISAGVDIVTNRTIDVNGFGPMDFLSLAALEGPAGNIPMPYMAVRIPADRYAELTKSGDAPILAAHFLTAPFDPSAVQTFPEAMIATGTVNPDGTVAIDVANPLVRVRGIVGRDVEFTPVYFNNPKALGRLVSDGIASGQIGDLFVVLAIPPPPYPGPSGMPPYVGLSCHAERDTLSYFTLDGQTFRPLRFCELLFSLIVAEPAVP